MTCRHSPGDPNCSSNRGYAAPDPQTPDAANFFVEEIEEVGRCIVMKVRYPNCARCSYEGNKVMVFVDIRTIDVVRWKTIDPHFRSRKDERVLKAVCAPSPSARFPGDAEGWRDAIEYARRKNEERPQ